MGAGSASNTILTELAAVQAVPGVAQTLFCTFKLSTVICMPAANAAPEIACDPALELAAPSAAVGGGGTLPDAAAHHSARAPAGCAFAGPVPAVPFALALCTEMTPMFTLSPLTVAEPVCAVAVRRGADTGVAFGRLVELVLATGELERCLAWAVPVDACPQPRLSIIVKNRMRITIGA